MHDHYLTISPMGSFSPAQRSPFPVWRVHIDLRRERSRGHTPPVLAVTFYFFHCLICVTTSDIWKPWYWWVLLVLAILACSLTAEFICVRSELAEIPMSELQGDRITPCDVASILFHSRDPRFRSLATSTDPTPPLPLAARPGRATAHAPTPSAASAASAASRSLGPLSSLLPPRPAPALPARGSRGRKVSASGAQPGEIVGLLPRTDDIEMGTRVPASPRLPPSPRPSLPGPS